MRSHFCVLDVAVAQEAEQQDMMVKEAQHSLHLWEPSRPDSVRRAAKDGSLPLHRAPLSPLLDGRVARLLVGQWCVGQGEEKRDEFRGPRTPASRRDASGVASGA
jgi:hypothetical protein